MWRIVGDTFIPFDSNYIRDLADDNCIDQTFASAAHKSEPNKSDFFAFDKFHNSSNESNRIQNSLAFAQYGRLSSMFAISNRCAHTLTHRFLGRVLICKLNFTFELYKHIDFIGRFDGCCCYKPLAIINMKWTDHIRIPLRKKDGERDRMDWIEAIERDRGTGRPNTPMN